MLRHLRKLLAVLGAAVLLLVGIAAIRTAQYRPIQQTVIDPPPDIVIPEGAAERLAGSIRIPTISHEDSAAFDAVAFRGLHAYLHTAFPAVHAQLQREIVANHSLLYTWRGSDTSLKPILLLGHLDVVPVEPGTETRWQQAPFAGRISDGFIWGRGAIDNKSAVVGILEAIEILLREGFRPRRTVYVAFGHDEEVGGKRGARQIAELLKRRGVKLEMVLDEGGVIGEGILPGVSAPIAMVGIAEKGFVTIELNTRAAGGHSSLPPPHTTVGILSAAIARVEANPMPARLHGATRQLFDHVGRHFPLGQRAVLANLWLTSPLVIRNLERTPSTNAMVRTTLAPTVFQAGTKDNVLASYARAAINARILPGDSVAGVVSHVRRTVNDNRVEVRMGGSFSAEPSVVSSTRSESYQMLERAIRSVSRDVIVAPFLVVVVTDARYYAGLSDNVFRFLPIRLTQQDLQRMHGTDERISLRGYEAAIRTYRQIIVDAVGG